MYDPMNQIVAIDENNEISASPAEPTGNNHHTHIIHYEDGSGGVIEDAATDNGGVYVSSPNVATQAVDDSSQLTLSFRGQVYVFDSVSPQKVQAVLLLLGGCEAPSGSQCVEVPPLDPRGVLEYPKCSQPQRAASLNRFRQKRKERCFVKKVRYGVRQEVALRMQRNKGQFTSAKKQDGGNGLGADQESVQDAVQSETLCTHCGISSKSTPMMRRGPSGPRTLCNACGLFWANRGTLRDISKRNQEHSLAPPEQVGEGNNNLDSGTAIPAHNSLVIFTDNNKPAATISDR